MGYDDALRGDVLFVNDPGFTKPSYSYAKDVVGWRLYAMAQSHAEDINAQLDVLYGLRLRDRMRDRMRGRAYTAADA